MEGQLLDFTWPEDPTVTLTRFAVEGDEIHPALLVLPGGGYNTCAPGEGAPIAEAFASLGYEAFVLNYSVRFECFEDRFSGKTPNPHTLFPEPLLEIAAVMCYIRAHAAGFRIAPDQLAIAGFSAGGHLASSFSNVWCDTALFADPQAIRPNACILGYAATEMTADEMILPAVFGQRDSYPEALRNTWSSALHVSENTAPTFLFHSVTDPMVPVRESMDMAKALDAAGVPYEMHLFGCGGHAYGLGKGENAGAWVGLADTFLKTIFSAPEKYNREVVKGEMHRHFQKLHDHNSKKE